MNEFFSFERDGLVEFSAESNGRQPRGSEGKKIVFYFNASAKEEKISNTAEERRRKHLVCFLH